MLEQGTVIEINGPKTVVQMKPGEQCGHCRACMMASSGMRLEVDTVEGVSVGDVVSIEVPVERMRAVFLVFVVPLAALIAGAVLGNYLGRTWWPDSANPDLPAIVLGVLFPALALGGLFGWERTTGRRRMRPRIVRNSQ